VEDIAPDRLHYLWEKGEDEVGAYRLDIMVFLLRGKPKPAVGGGE
jgi:hypothetical protein